MGNDQPKPEPEPKPDPLFPENWRPFQFDKTKKDSIKEEVWNLKVSNPEVQNLRILLHGPVGSGKSSFINSIDSIFQGRMAQGALADSMSHKSFTKRFQSHRIKAGRTGKFLPFVISDIMGLEDTAEDGAHVNDITLALNGHLKDNHCFNPTSPLKKGDANYNSCPTLSDQIHCLVSVLPADKITMMGHHNKDNVICKLRTIREKASELNIPQVILMTKVDYVCPIVNKDLTMVYRSKRIKEKMQICSSRLGVPMNAIFPVKNYHEEIDLDNNVDILLLSALRNILNFADDHVGEKGQK